MAKKNWIPKNLKKGRCTPMPNPDCPVGSPQYNLGMTFKKKASKGGEWYKSKKKGRHGMKIKKNNMGYCTRLHSQYN